MAIFNKQGVQFSYLVSLPRDPNVDPTYSHKFPARLPSGKVVERWARKVRPIKDMTRILQGNNLKRNIDYMIEYNGINEHYEYWFKDAMDAATFKLSSVGVAQKLSLPGYNFKIECPCCKQTFERTEIKWI